MTKSSRPYLRVLALLGVALAAWALGGSGALATLATTGARIEHLGPLGPALFVLGYAVSTVALIPGSVLTLAAGLVFGVLPGTLYAFTGAVTGSMASFVISRYLAREVVAHRLADRPVLAAIDAAIGREGGRIVFLLRLSPLVPFAILNYLLGLSSVTLRSYAVASIGMLPGTLLYAYAGSVAGSLAEATTGTTGQDGASRVLLILGLTATITVVVVITRIARRALSATLNGDAS